MDLLGIHSAFVSPLEGILYANVQDANRLMYNAIKNYKNSFFPFYVINPAFPTWEDDLEECITKLGIFGIRLFPNYHNYSLSDAFCGNLFAIASKKNIPIQIVSQIQDSRVIHKCMQMEQTELLPLESLLSEFSELQIGILNLDISSFDKYIELFRIFPNLFIELSTMEGVGMIDHLIEKIGIEKILFGTKAPLFLPLSTIYKLKECSLTLTQIEKITHENAIKFLGKTL